MDEILVVGVGQLLRFGVVDLGEDEGGKRRGAGGCGGGIFCQDCRAVCDAGAVVAVVLAVPGQGRNGVLEKRSRGG